MISKTTATLVAVTMSFGTLVMTSSFAFAYKSEADCESFEGVGKCSYCVLGEGDDGWHRSSACVPIRVNPNNPRELNKAVKDTTDASGNSVGSKVVKGVAKEK